MIPSIPDILEQVRKGDTTPAQADEWIRQHLQAMYEEQQLLDMFAVSAVVHTTAEGTFHPSSVRAVMGDALAPPLSDNHHEKFMWWCKVEARIRYAKANAMLEARAL